MIHPGQTLVGALARRGMHYFAARPSCPPGIVLLAYNHLYACFSIAIYRTFLCFFYSIVNNFFKSGSSRAGGSFLHVVDPRAKVGSFAFALAAVFWPDSALRIVFVCPLAVAAIAASGISAAGLFRGIKPFLWFFVFAVFVHALTIPGKVLILIPFAGVPVTLEGLGQGLGLSARLTLAIAFSSLLTMTTSPIDLVWALERAASPLTRLGLPVRDFCVTMFFAMRFFPLLRDEAARLAVAAAARGAYLNRGGLPGRIRLMAKLAVPLLRRVFLRAEAIARAMEARGFQPGQQRPLMLAHKNFGWKEAVVLGFSAVAFLATCLLPVKGSFY